MKKYTTDTYKKLAAAFKDANARNEACIVVQSHNGIKYWMHEDQLEYVDGSEGCLICCSVIKKHPRAKTVNYWLNPENITVLTEEA